jgi:hypothetical protein
MQKWWVAGGAVVAVALAVLVIGRPDTGGEVTERDLETPTVEAQEPGEDDLIRGGGSRGGNASRSPSAVVLDENGMVIPVGDVRASKPGSRELALRQQQPEAQWAARSMAPWTQIRRQLASQDAEHPAIAEVSGLIGEIRELRLDPAKRDVAAILEQQAAVEASVRSSGLVNDEIERMLELLNSRQGAYERGDYSPENLKAAAEGKDMP